MMVGHGYPCPTEKATLVLRGLVGRLIKDKKRDVTLEDLGRL
jgi:hypothetical protein